MTLLYNIGIKLYSIMIFIASFFNEKAKFIHKGRKNSWEIIENANLGSDVIWIHCASLGEFEQGRPIIEKIKIQNSKYKVVLSFFSPSGYEVRKNYKEADLVVYLPADTNRNAKKLIKLINPKIAIFVKYEYWYHYFKELNNNQIPIYMVSAIFRPSQLFFKNYGGWYKNILEFVTHFYLQDQKSADLLSSIGVTNYNVVGDTRFDRVAEIAATAPRFENIEEIIQGKKVMVVGSSWPQDEDIIAEYINKSSDDFKFIIAPHEIEDSKIKNLISKLKVSYLRYTQLSGASDKNSKVLIIDTIGMLSFIYQYADIAYIGGGFGKGIHNILEAATFGIPVIFGPNHTKFKEAMDLIEKGGAFPIKDEKDVEIIMNNFFYSENKDDYESTCFKTKSYVQEMSGATAVIMKDLKI